MNEPRRDVSTLPRILVVEDEADLALLLTYNLEAEGYAAESVERGDEAELRLIETPPDLVILDWMLPGVSGLEICRRLRAREATRTLPVIMRNWRRCAASKKASTDCGCEVAKVSEVVTPLRSSSSR